MAKKINKSVVTYLMTSVMILCLFLLCKTTASAEEKYTLRTTPESVTFDFTKDTQEFTVELLDEAGNVVLPEGGFSVSIEKDNYTEKSISFVSGVEVGGTCSTGKFTVKADLEKIKKSYFSIIGHLSISCSNQDKYGGGCFERVPIYFHTHMEKGTLINYSEGKYKVINGSGSYKVEFVAPKSKNVKSMTIPGTIKDQNGAVYDVLKISSDAFNGCKKLKKLSIGIVTVKYPKRLFKDCKSLGTINFTVLPGFYFSHSHFGIYGFQVGKDAFKGIKNNAKINAVVYILDGSKGKNTASDMKAFLTSAIQTKGGAVNPSISVKLKKAKNS
ncbi:MAG: hypothetical protein E7302_11440 [Butyrivibrio sp.]|nr:hypothetical protein [Butyrivibrio sp.]